MRSTPVPWLHSLRDAMGFWAGTFSLPVFGLAGPVTCAWLLRIDRGWPEITRGARTRMPSQPAPAARRPGRVYRMEPAGWLLLIPA